MDHRKSVFFCGKVVSSFDKGSFSNKNLEYEIYEGLFGSFGVFDREIIFGESTENILDTIRRVYGNYEDNYEVIDALWASFLDGIKENNINIFKKSNPNSESEVEPWVYSWVRFVFNSVSQGFTDNFKKEAQHKALCAENKPLCSENTESLSVENTESLSVENTENKLLSVENIEEVYLSAESMPSKSIENIESLSVRNINSLKSNLCNQRASSENFYGFLSDYIRNMKDIGTKIIDAIRTQFICQDPIGSKRIENTLFTPSIIDYSRPRAFLYIPKEFKPLFLGIEFIPLFIRNICLQKIDGVLPSPENLFKYMEDVCSAALYLSQFNYKGPKNSNYMAYLLSQPNLEKIRACLSVISSFDVGNTSENHIYKTWGKPYRAFLSAENKPLSSFSGVLNYIKVEDLEDSICVSAIGPNNKCLFSINLYASASSPEACLFLKQVFMSSNLENMIFSCAKDLDLSLKFHRYLDSEASSVSKKNMLNSLKKMSSTPFKGGKNIPVFSKDAIEQSSFISVLQKCISNFYIENRGARCVDFEPLFPLTIPSSVSNFYGCPSL
jgi:hypothetical protein